MKKNCYQAFHYCIKTNFKRKEYRTLKAKIKNWNHLDPHSQIENDEEPVSEISNLNDSEETETSKASVIVNFMPKILPNDDIAEGLNSLN